jgi:hypothetical protein
VADHQNSSADIVERLRSLNDGVSRPVSILEREVCGQAADEIERLARPPQLGYRDLVRELGQAAEEYDRGHGPLHAAAANAIQHLETLLQSRDDAQPAPELLFCHWLKGYLGAVKGRDELTPHEANTIRGNLNELLSSDGEPSNGKQPLMASRPAPPVPSDPQCSAGNGGDK